MPRTQSTSNLIPVVEVSEIHFVTFEGRVGVILEAGGRNISIMSAEEAEGLVAAYADVLNYLDTHVHMQVVISNSPLSAEQWVPLHMRQYDVCPPAWPAYATRSPPATRSSCWAGTYPTCATKPRLIIPNTCRS